MPPKTLEAFIKIPETLFKFAIPLYWAKDEDGNFCLVTEDGELAGDAAYKELQKTESNTVPYRPDHLK